MRRIAFAAVMLMGVLTIAGCAKVDELFNEKTERITFVASFADPTRTSYKGGGKVDWVEGDSIWYYTKKGGSIGEYEVVRSGHSTNVVADVASGTSYIVAAYGGTGITDNTVTSFTLNGAVKATQTGTFEDAHVSVAKGFDIEDGASLAFHNMTSVISFSLERTDVSYITFTANGGEKIHGDGAMKITFKDDQPSVVFGDGGGSSIRVNTSGAGTFYIATLPVELAKGFEIDYFDAAGNNIAHTVYDKTFVIGNDELINLGTLDGRMVNSLDVKYVDLGLSVKWATCNLGASNPAYYGDYYQWAGTTEVTDKSIYLDWSNCPYHAGSSYLSGWTKYIPSNESSYWSGSGSPDNNTVLDPEDDVAHVKLGGKWRIPTEAEWQELVDNCTSEWTTLNGVKGRKFTSRKNGNSIFLPAAGYRDDSGLYCVGSDGNYWSSSLYTDYPRNAYSLFFYSGSGNTSRNYRSQGQSVRPVYDDTSVVTGNTCTLADGPTFNVILKELSGSASTIAKDSIVTDAVTKIVFIPQSPSTAGVRISAVNSGCPAYASYDPISDYLTITSVAEQFELGSDASFMFAGFSKCKEISGLSYFITGNCINTGRMFMDCSSLKSIDLSSFDFCRDTSMMCMFANDSSLTNIVWPEEVNMMNLQNLGHTFRGTKFSVYDLSKWKNLKSLSGTACLFAECPNCSKVIFPEDVDFSCVSSVTDWFYHSSENLKLDLTCINTETLPTLRYMFSACYASEIDCTGWNTENTVFQSYLFYNCLNLHALRLGDGFLGTSCTSSTCWFAGTINKPTGDGALTQTGIVPGHVDIYCSSDVMDWVASRATVMYVNDGYYNGVPCPVKFYDWKSGREYNPGWH